MSVNKATTIHGEVEYETVGCSNCENDVLEEEAIHLHLDPKVRTCQGVSICDAEHTFPSAERSLCPHCAESIFDYRRGFRGKCGDLATRMKWDWLMVTMICITAVVITGLVLGVLA